MNKEIEEKLNEAIQKAFEVGSSQVQMDRLEDLFSEKLMVIGTVANEIYDSLDGLRTLINNQLEQGKGMELKFDREEIYRDVRANETIAIVVERIHMFITINSDTIQFDMRASNVLEYADGTWKVIHWHVSKPDQVQSEADTYGIAEWKEKADQLEKIVAQRTADLLERNQQLEEAMNNLRKAQSQLIHSEKMASLGELTAGIAHEIQNPLNFVNNFGEINADLVDEVKIQNEKLKSQNPQMVTDEIDDLLSDISNNTQKIVHHGKRAESIVKGMLQHSQSSSGKKEPTDINDLADEYLRLAYHGLRAKDINFNATLITEFDSSLPIINIIPQDIGRVLLNIFTNAFYAINEKKKTAHADYTGILKIQTQNPPSEGRGAFIRISDNGPGIPSSILSKIFQPFFTTKPTGQGTGLGLSLAYDIIKAHGGELTVETKEKEGTIFTIQLPLSQ